MDEPSRIENWERISILGSGAFGVVTLWRDTVSDSFVAIKKCKFQKSNTLTDKQRKRWANEVDIMKNIKHVNIVNYQQIPAFLENELMKYNPSKLPLLTMEYCKMGNLRYMLNNTKNCCGLLETDIRFILDDIANGLAFLHRYNITHRDIKPENIVLQQIDTRKYGIIYKIIDLGYAKELNDTIVSFVGTLHYLAPEIVKAQTYNYSVDYWSLGIVAFEIICGVLPFLPQLDPFQRFEYIQKKKKEDICIYFLRSGSISYSPELLKEHHISNCLKQNLEIWLRHVLNYDPTERSLKFNDNTNVFENLLNILKKQIITVFSVTTLEFYSYEINDSTLVGTLKDWIARDIKVARNEQILLTTKTNWNFTDNHLVIDIITDDGCVYVMKQDCFINRSKRPTSPVTVQILFQKCTETFEWKELRPIYCKTLFFLIQQSKLLKHLLISFQLLVKFVRDLTNNMKLLLHQIHTKSSKVLLKIESYINIRTIISKNDIEIIDTVEYEKCLMNFQKLTTNLDTATQTVNTLIKKVDILRNRQEILDKLYPKINQLIVNCDIQKQIDEAVLLIEKGPGDDRNAIKPTPMVKIVSNALKIKDELFKNTNFDNYLKATFTALKDVQLKLYWMSNFYKEIDRLENDIDKNEMQQYHALFTNKSQNKRNSIEVINAMSDVYVSSDAETIIKENQELRYRFEEVFSNILINHKRLCEESQPLLQHQF